MTGFGRSDSAIGDYHYTVEVKSVNHRFLECRFRLPPSLSLLEIPINEALRSRFERGAFEVSVKSRLSGKRARVAGMSRFVVDEAALASLQLALQRVAKTLGRDLPLSCEALIQSNRVIVSVDDEKDFMVIWSGLKKIVDRSFVALEKMRASEGQRIHGVLARGVDQLRDLLKTLTAAAQSQPQLIRDRLADRLSKWKLQSIDPQRLELELALFADKAEVSEELDRAGGHLDEFCATMKKRSGVGRRLDFLLQELNREFNTLGAKAVSLGVSRGVIEAKHVIEKLREQVQNVE